MNTQKISSENSGELIKFYKVSKKYKKLLALDEISFTINKGDIFGYIGPNGAGKTTTIKILVGLIKDYEGNVYLQGKKITKNTYNIHKILGYHPQDVGFQEWRTVDHLLKTFGQLAGLHSADLESNIQEVLKFVNLQEVRYKKIIHLSGGMIQKLRLAQALLSKPEILVLDEPLSGLDPFSRYQLKNLIRTLSKEGKTILFSSHILSDVQDIATKIGILNNGKIMKIGTPDELQNEFHVGNIIEIEYANNAKHCAGFESISNIERVEKFNSNKDLIHLKSNQEIDICIQDILKMITEQKCKIRNFKLVKPSLEDMYLKYVGGND
ncbi:MAG: ATP-binding cassette domain-containing protein [Candidatus Hodarchaeota archaeon]